MQRLMHRILLVRAIKLDLYAGAMSRGMGLVGCERSCFPSCGCLFCAARLSWEVHAGTYMEVSKYCGLSVIIR